MNEIASNSARKLGTTPRKQGAGNSTNVFRWLNVHRLQLTQRRVFAVVRGNDVGKFITIRLGARAQNRIRFLEPLKIILCWIEH